MRKLALFLISISILTSCEKKHITGTVMDNLGNPIEAVSISVKNTSFKTVTNNVGNFSLDYAPGVIEFLVEKDGYIGYNKQITITEKSKYPIGKIEIVKKPQKEGLFCILSGEYIMTPKIKMSSVKKRKYDDLGGVYLDVGYSVKEDSILTVHSSENLSVKFMDNAGLALKLVKVDTNLYAANYKVSSTSYDVTASYAEEEVKQITKDLRERTVHVEKGQIYAYLNIIDYYGIYQKMSDVAYVFIVE